MFPLGTLGQILGVEPDVTAIDAPTPCPPVPYGHFCDMIALGAVRRHIARLLCELVPVPYADVFASICDIPPDMRHNLLTPFGWECVGNYVSITFTNEPLSEPLAVTIH